MRNMKNRMMKTTSILAWALMSCSIALAQQQKQPQIFRVIPEFPKEQDTVQLVYDARNTVLKDAKDISAQLTGYTDFKWTTTDLKFIKNDSVWIAKYILPAHLALMNLVFKSDTLVDKGGEQTYSYILSANDKRQMSGGMLGWGMLRAPHIVAGVPYVVDSTSYKTDEILLMWVKYELQYHPENRFRVLYAAASALKHMNTPESLAKLNKELNTLEQIPDIREEDLLEIYRVYKDLLKDSTKAEAIQQKIIGQFPNGQYVKDQQRLADFNLIQKAKTDDERLKAATDFIDKHPYQEAEVAFNEANRISYISAYWIISVYTSMRKDLANYSKYMSKIAPYEALSNVIYRSLDVPYISQKSMGPAEILPYARVIMERLNYYKDNYQGDKYATLYYGNAPLFAKILVDNKLYDEAFVYAAAAQSTASYKNADLNDTYVRVLEGQGKTKELQMALEKSYAMNQSSTYMLELMKKSYNLRNKSDKGYEQYLAGLRNADKGKELKEKVQRLLINKDIADFELLDQHGKKVRLSAQKGKIVVLDFWASWCAPCKGAFPGMKLAVDHFKNDPNVVFYFINTQERKSDMKEYVTNYMKENNYPFTVLLDADSKASKAAGVGPIPHKMVIGPNGKLRFSEVGYMGSTSELADEIIEMVNVLKAGK
ncbi:peroxiredoxin family protein [Sphingobacterium multivorum]|uniref:peroxiredoxin family protein n=1 Tax=Sphingobacterium multivorum TaxID=28454 RepID=UPI00289B1FC8|nr:TlpA disulfide reductase family protein [Sphingobacterium multivorum]